MKKTALVIAAIVLSATLARANLIDLTPGGFDLANIVNGQPVWSPFTPFGPPNFGLTLNPSGTGANVGWNLFGTGFRGLFVFVESSRLIANLYAIPGRFQFNGDGFVEIDGTIPILGVTFAGKSAVPDGGSTLMMLGIAVGTVVFAGRRICT